MKEQSVLSYVNKIVKNFKYKYGIITGPSTGASITLDYSISVEYLNNSKIERYNDKDVIQIKENDIIDLIITDIEILKKFERELYSIVPDNNINKSIQNRSKIESLFKRIYSIKSIEVNEKIHLMIINSKDGLAEKNRKYIPEINDYPYVDDAKYMLNLRLQILEEAKKLDNKELKYMVIIQMKYPVLGLKLFNINERKILCGAIQYRRYLHYSEYSKMMSALHYKYPNELMNLLEAYSMQMAERGLIL